jgi:glycosyltransferase involved in cell wall biosynthesis
MRILLSSSSMQAGGAEQVVTMLAEGLAARGNCVGVAAPPGPRDEDLRDVPHSRLPLDDHGRAAGGAAQTAIQLARAIHRFSPDVVHAQNVKATVIARAGALAARPRRRPPVLTTFHGVLPVEYRRSARLLQAADHVACVSPDLYENIVAAGLKAWRATLVRNAITPADPLEPGDRTALDEELGIAGAPVVAIVGRLVPQKAHQRFIAAARLVADQLPAARFLILGDGPCRGEIEAMVAAAALGDKVQLTGVRSDARKIIARAEIVAFSSDWEGLSIAALEALAAGTPVVSTDVQGMRELLVESGAGAVVPLDEGTALGQRILALLCDDGERRRMGATGERLIASDYSPQAMIDSYERLYKRLTDR